jgi:hypothetical protein
MTPTHLLPLLSVVALSLAVPASAGVSKAVLACSAEARVVAPVAADYFFYHGLVSQAPALPGNPAPSLPCPRSKVTRT